MRIAVLADTHIRDQGATRLPDRAWSELRNADVILHADDVVGTQFLDALRALAPVYAVRGNNDVDLVDLPETREVELDSVPVAMIHDSGPRRGREARLRRRFPESDLVVFGHSHIPWDAAGVDVRWLFNPGSATLRRRQPHKTMGVVDVRSGRVRTGIVTLA